MILPEELLARLKLQEGDTVFLTEAANGAIMMTTYDADFELQMGAARTIMESGRQVLSELAK